MKKNFLKWIFALCIATIAGANMFAFESYKEVAAGNGLYDIEVYTSSELAHYLSQGNIWPKGSALRTWGSFGNKTQNINAAGITANSFPKGEVCIIISSDFDDNVSSIVIPEKIDGYPVVGAAALNLYEAKSVTLPKNFVFLGEFDGDNIETIKIQSSNLYFLYNHYEYDPGFLTDFEGVPLSEKSKADLRKAGYKGEFN